MSQLRALVERIEKIEEEIKSFNDDKRDIYAEAKANGFDVKALKSVIAYRRKDPAERQEHDAIVEVYIAELERGTVVATRARAREQSPAEQPESASRAILREQLTASIALADTDFPEIPSNLDRRVRA